MVAVELKSLPNETIRLLGSSQVITSVFSVVKELVENSFDAEAKSIEVKLESYGLDKVEIRDNGYGIKAASMTMVAKRHHTSKISSFTDLDHLETYGFRGEALGSLCSVSTLSITSKTSEEDVSYTYMFDHQGNITSQVPSYLGQGTTICAVSLFKNMPVRRQFYNTIKKKKEELKKIEDLLMAYGAIRPDVRILLKNDKDIVWQKKVQPDTMMVLLGVFGRSCVSQMEHKVEENKEFQISIEAFLPRSHCDVSCTSRSTNDRCFIAVNKRPVNLKDIEKIVKQHYTNHLSCDGRHPMFFIHITVQAGDLDVNVDPNKTQVMLHKQNVIIELLTVLLEELYGPIQKPKQDDKHKEIQAYNDSTMLDISSNSSLDTSVEGTEYRTSCLKERNMNVDTEYVVTRPLLQKYDIGGAGQSLSKQDSEKSISGSTDQTSKHAENSDHLLNQDKVCLGNRLVVHHTPSVSMVTPVDSHQVNTVGSVVQGSKVFVTSEQMTNVDACMEQKMEEIDVLTQTEKGVFNMLDSDFEDLLKTQNNNNVHSSDNVTNLNSTDAMLADIDITLVGDIGELRKLGPHENSSENNTVNNVKEMPDKESCSTEQGNKPDAINWSRGTSGIFENGMNVQPVQLLAAGSHVTRKRPPSPNQDLDTFDSTPPSKRKSTDLKLDQPKLYEMVGCSPVDKSSRGFLAFSKEIRPKVLEENPGASYDEITKIVRQRWMQLSADDQEQFDNKGKIQMQELKKTASVNKKLSQKIDRRLQAVVGTPSIKDQLLAYNKKREDPPDIPVKSVSLIFSLKKLKHVYTSKLRQTQTQRPCRLKLLGPLKFYSSWVCCHGNKIQVLNPHRVEETLLHRELMENHIIPSSRLENPIGVTESSVGGVAMYEKLIEMLPRNTSQTYVYIEDRRLKANGIEIQCHLDEHSKPVLEIVGLANCMPLYGVKDLHEILEVIVNTGANTVNQCRPLKVVNYLQGEAVRMVRQRPVHRSREDLEELLEQMEDSLPANCVTCLHNKPFVNTIYDMTDVIQSQTTSKQTSLFE